MEGGCRRCEEGMTSRERESHEREKGTEREGKGEAKQREASFLWSFECLGIRRRQMARGTAPFLSSLAGNGGGKVGG